MSAFGGWTLFGQLTTVLRNQATTILLNQSFNPGVVAARSIATNIGAQIGVFSNSFNTSLYPPIVKAYAAKESQEMYSLILGGSRLTFYLMWIFAWPLMLKMEWAMNLWLVNPPKDVVEFTRLAFVESLIFAVSMPLAAAARAPGKMKGYEIVLGLMQTSMFLLSWLAIGVGYEANSVYMISIAISLLMFAARAVLVQGLIGLRCSQFAHGVIVPVFRVTCVSIGLALGVDYLLPKGGIFPALVVAASTTLTAATVYYLGLSATWRMKIVRMMREKILQKEYRK